MESTDSLERIDREIELVERKLTILQEARREYINQHNLNKNHAKETNKEIFTKAS